MILWLSIIIILLLFVVLYYFLSRKKNKNGNNDFLKELPNDLTKIKELMNKLLAEYKAAQADLLKKYNNNTKNVDYQREAADLTLNYNANYFILMKKYRELQKLDDM